LLEQLEREARIPGVGSPLQGKMAMRVYRCTPVVSGADSWAMEIAEYDRDSLRDSPHPLVVIEQESTDICTSTM